MPHYAVVNGRAGAHAAPQGARGLDTHWAQFGDGTLIWGDRAVWARLAGRLPGAGLDEASEARGRLYLVGQVGRAFQIEFPDARIVAGGGRYLAVDLTGEELASIREHPEICWSVRPLPEDRVIWESLAPAARAPVAWVQTLVDRLSAASYRGYLAHLASYPTRHSLSAHFPAAAGWARAQLAGMGYDAQVIPITVGAGSSANVTAARDGQAPPTRDLVLVTAHLDSINIAGGPSAAAPGADDNASGAAAALEIARVLAGHPSPHDARVVLFGGEEQGLHGSQQYVASMSAADRARLRAVINMDMVATRNAGRHGVLLEGAAVSQRLIDDLSAAAAAYTSLEVSVSLNPFASDHVPFINAALPAVLTIEAADQSNGNIHSSQDTMAHIDEALALDIARMNLATAVTRLGSVETAGLGNRASGPVVAWGANRLDVFVLGTNRAVYHKWWNGAAWGPSGTGYEAMGGIGVSRPEAVAWGPDRLDVFVVGTDSGLYHKAWNGGAWSPSLTGYAGLGGLIQGQPKAVAWGANRLDVFVLGTNRGLYHKWWDGGGWRPTQTGYE
jgi:hypothetical protein